MRWIAVLACGAACAPSYRLPLTAAQLAAAREPAALVAYLAQPGADPAVCDAGSPGSHVAIDEAAGGALVVALRDGTLAPAAWTACAERILASADRSRQRSLLEAVLAGYRSVLADRAVERDPRVQARLAALAAAYDLRSPEARAQPDTAGALIAQLRGAPYTLGPFARRSAAAMLVALELDQGMWCGQVVDEAVLDALAAQGDEAALAALAARLPDAALRAAARHRAIRLRIAASPFPEVRDDAPHVEAMMMELGKNPISPRLQPPTAASVDPDKLALRGALVVQDVRRQTARLIAAGPDRSANGPGAAPGRDAPPAVGIAPVALRDALAIEVTGLSRPVALCGARGFDPSPCLLPGDVAVASPLAWLDGDGALHFSDQMTARQTAELARAGVPLALPLAFAGRPLVSLRWPLRFAVPGPLVVAGRGGQDGPALRIAVDEHHGRLIYAIDDGSRVRLAVTERGDAGRFRIVSRGGDGAPGSSGAPGSDGMAGSDGASATCPASGGGDGDGGNGGDGRDGEDGGRGGDGGAIAVRVTCDDGVCGDLVAALREAIASEPGTGGPGGPGGRGGAGGAGGRGGSGATCVGADGTLTQLDGGADGARGHDGRDGNPGLSGGGGRRGAVRFEVHRAAPVMASP
jgi:hypothetical protein